MGDKTADTDFHPWKIIPNMLFSNIGGLEIMFHSNLKLSNHCASQIKSYPKFYQNLIQLWEDVSEEEPKDVSEICEEIIRNNRMIISNCQTLFNKSEQESYHRTDHSQGRKRGDPDIS